MGEIIKVGMADLKVCAYPDSLTTLGLGSCVGIALYDSVTKITRNENIAKFADTGIEETVRLMLAKGANKKRIVAKIAGGADMFNMGRSAQTSFRVGESNVQAVKAKLKELDIPILAEDVGLNYGRTVIIKSEDGGFIIKSVGKPIKEI